MNRQRDTFDYTVTDGNGGTATATVTVTITGVNDAPVAVGDTATTDEDNPVAIDGAVLLANDSDIDGDTLSIASIDTTNTTGNVTDNGDGTFSYDPNGSFENLAVGQSATDTFDYTVTDGNGGTATASVTVTITGVNDAPVANDDTLSTDENQALTFAAADLLGNDTDVDDGDVLSLVSVDTGSLQGVLVDNGDGTFTYTPPSGFSGADTFTYTISDGNGESDTAAVTIQVQDLANQAPDAVDDGFSTGEDSALLITGASLLSNDTDPDVGDVLSIASIDDSATLGTVTDNGDGTYTYDPNGQFESLAVGESATDTFAYTVSDGNGGTDTATVTITVNGVNDAPVAADDDLITDEDSPLVIAGSTLLGNDDDVDTSDTLTIASIDDSATVGTVTDNGDGTYTYDPNGQFESLAAGESATDTFSLHRLGRQRRHGYGDGHDHR